MLDTAVSHAKLTELAWTEVIMCEIEVHIGATWRIREIDLCGYGDAACRWHTLAT